MLKTSVEDLERVVKNNNLEIIRDACQFKVIRDVNDLIPYDAWRKIFHGMEVIVHMNLRASYNNIYQDMLLQLKIGGEGG